jgi:hypothetical protein
MPKVGVLLELAEDPGQSRDGLDHGHVRRGFEKVIVARRGLLRSRMTVLGLLIRFPISVLIIGCRRVSIVLIASQYQKDMIWKIVHFPDAPSPAALIL